MIINPGIDADHKTVVVVGVQRGGTSMVAGVLRELGINLGVNLGNNHEDPKFLPLETEKILKVVQERNKEHRVWGWKMPHSSEYIADIYKELRNPHVVIVFRNLLGMATSQMKRSDANFENAFQFSKNRLAQVASLVGQLDCPLLAVNYEEAMRVPKPFIEEVTRFLHISPSGMQLQNATRIIDPETGYQRISDEAWRYDVLKLNEEDRASSAGLNQSERRMVNLFFEDDQIKKTDKLAFIEFDQVSTKSNTVFLDLKRVGKTDEVRVVVNVGKGFSGMLQERIKLYMGHNRVKIIAPKIHAVRVFPGFDGIVSNITNVSLSSD